MGSGRLVNERVRELLEQGRSGPRDASMGAVRELEGMVRTSREIARPAVTTEAVKALSSLIALGADPTVRRTAHEVLVDLGVRE